MVAAAEELQDLLLAQEEELT
jgi:hypothetical protein